MGVSVKVYTIQSLTSRGDVDIGKGRGTVGGRLPVTLQPPPKLGAKRGEAEPGGWWLFLHPLYSSNQKKRPPGKNSTRRRVQLESKVA